MTNVGEKAKAPGCLWAACAFIGLLIVGYITTLMFQPERLARSMSCVGPYGETGAAYPNTCDKDINARLCLFGTDGSDICRTLELAPGDGFDRDQIAADLADLNGLLRIVITARDAPYLPDKVVDPNTKRLKDGCTQP